MEGEALDGSTLARLPLSSSGSKSAAFYLVRVPVDISFSDLDGLEIDFDNHRDYKINGGKRVKIAKENASTSKNFRPLIYDAIGSSTVVGPSFQSTISIQPSIHLPPIPTELPDAIEDSYCVKSQLDFIQVRSVPIGSQSTVEEILERSRNTVARKPPSSHQRAAPSNAEIPATDKKKSEETKKDKKQKKEGKKSKHEKKEKDR